MRILFMGTPDIAAGILRTIAGAHNVVGVFCQPDKPVGRKATLTPPPVKVCAEALGIQVYQPVKMRDGSAAALVRALAPEAIVVVAYGRVLPKEILEVPPHGCINVHVSLLPAYRGAAPIQHAILCGEKQSGVTVMQMDEGIDTGDILQSEAFAIAPDDDATVLFCRAEQIGGNLLLRVLEDIEQGKLRRTPQTHEAASYAPPVTKEMSLFHFSDDAETIVNKVRAFCIWPVARFTSREKTVQVLRAKTAKGSGTPGVVLSLDPLTIATENGAVSLLEVKPEGSRAMSGRAYASGIRLKIGDTL